LLAKAVDLRESPTAIRRAGFGPLTISRIAFGARAHSIFEKCAAR